MIIFKFITFIISLFFVYSFIDALFKNKDKSKTITLLFDLALTIDISLYIIFS